MEGERLTRVASFYAIGILNAVISITVLGLYLYRRSEREYLWFAILLLASAALSALTVSSYILDFSQDTSDFAAESIGAIGITASLLFFSKVLEAKRSWLWYTVLVIALLDPLNVLLYVTSVLSPATTTSLRILFEIPIVLYIVGLLCNRAITGNRNARLLFMPTMLLYGTAILGGALLLTFQLGWQSQTLASIHRWNVLEKPFEVHLQVFVQLVFVVALLAFLIRRFARSRAKEERFTADIEAARMIQSLLIPETLPAVPNLEILAAYHPAQEVGGDLYQIFLLPNPAANSQSDTLIVLGDVAGKGLPAAMTVSLLVGSLRSLVETTGSPGMILAGLNRRLVGMAHDLRKWLADTGAKTMYSEPGSPWENGYCESFNSKMRDEFLNGEIFYSIKELRVLAERWRKHYNTARPHSSLGYQPPAPEAWLASTVRRQEEPVASLPTPLAAIELRSVIRPQMLGHALDHHHVGQRFDHLRA